MLASDKWHYAGCGCLGLAISAATKRGDLFGLFVIATVLAFATASILKALNK